MHPVFHQAVFNMSGSHELPRKPAKKRTRRAYAERWISPPNPGRGFPNDQSISKRIGLKKNLGRLWQNNQVAGNCFAEGKESPPNPDALMELRLFARTRKS